MQFYGASFIYHHVEVPFERIAYMDLESLKLLETKITKFLERHEEVRREKDVLVQRLKEKEQQFAQLSGQLKEYEQERKEMKSRLEKILGRLNGLDLP